MHIIVGGIQTIICELENYSSSSIYMLCCFFHVHFHILSLPSLLINLFEEVVYTRMQVFMH